MRDLAFLGFLALVMMMGVRRPFLLVLGYVYVDLVSPQRMAYGVLTAIPVSLVFFAAAVTGWLLLDGKEGTRFTVRQMLLVLLLAWAGVTTANADFPIDAAEKWDWVWKTLVFAIFLPLTLRTRLRMEALLVFIILCACSIIITGGIKTLVSGGGYGMLNLGVAENSGLYEGSTISTVAIALIPLTLFVMRHGTIFPRGRMVQLFGLGVIGACLLIPIGTEARTGLICIGVLIVFALRDMTMRARAGFLTLLAVCGLAALPLLPSSYSQRMSTIEGYKGDESASTRIAVWMWTLDYVREHPGGGGFGAYRQNRFAYQRVDTDASRGGQTVMVKTVDEARAWHSSYFEMLGEQGYFGLALWLALQATGLVRMEMLRRRYRRGAEGERWIGDLATALQAAQLIYLIGSLFLALAFASFAYIWMGLQIALDVYAARARRAAAPVGFGQRAIRSIKGGAAGVNPAA